MAPVDIILTHENADFDGVAALLAAHKLDPSALPVAPRHANRNVRHFLALYWDALPLVLPDDLPREHVDRVVLVDTQSAVTLRGMDAQTEVQIVDHHPLGRELPPGWRYSGEPVGATTTLLVEQLAHAGISLSVAEATLLLLGIYEDTGSLGYVTTTAGAARAAAWLLDPARGAGLAIVRDFLNHPLSDAQQRLYARLLESVEMHDVNGHSIVLAAAEFPEYVEEVSTLAHRLRDLYDPHGLFLIVAMHDHVQVVGRSTTDNVDVARVTAALGGGGHSRAAAAFVRGAGLASVRAAILAALPAAVRPPVTVAAIMSKGVRTLPHDATVREAAERMSRYDHEGFPVVAADRVVGLLSRRAVDRARRHGLDGATIDRIMERGTVTVGPDDSVEQLQRVMMESGWGQVPVVAGGRVLGVVTRTDLIKLLTAPHGHAQARRAEVRARLEQALAPELLDLVRRIAAEADRLGYAAYFVGGLVRDLLLGHPLTDVDLVIEGDALALGRHLARQLGGRVRGHARFGTAKWFLPEALGGVARRAIDLVSARTEFYPHPSALPEVEHSSIKLDLHRRDFTINTLAIALAPDRFGELLDFWGGEQDLHDRLVRVLHSLSFVEDPTRILRAVRLTQRLGFRIESRTDELIAHAVPLLERVSGDRLRHELELILREPGANPEQALQALADNGALAVLGPGLAADDWFMQRCARLRAVLETGEWPLALTPPPARGEDGVTPAEALRVFGYFGLLLVRLGASAAEAVLARLHVKAETARDVRALARLRAVLAELTPDMAASALARQLEPFSPRALFVGWLASDSASVRAQILRHLTELRQVRPALDGVALQALGLPPGPLYGELLRRLRDARLDGLATSEAEERALLERWLAEERAGG
jgi:tRNA nucleotidyltransferase (CCA-adding enzyme)